jgi:hypothetical protein
MLSFSSRDRLRGSQVGHNFRESLASRFATPRSQRARRDVHIPRTLLKYQSVRAAPEPSSYRVKSGKAAFLRYVLDNGIQIVGALVLSRLGPSTYTDGHAKPMVLQDARPSDRK